ncbi:oxidoreductase with NAD(P)-binding Rossmann-fold domain protein [Legionella geestiana]|uniref:Oxidoreductase with NAD(P)-binding Rossmann-fold domain protein n=1 Tax=Legionella geestiana TaxID=45065 RepID=A0A0W0TW66_9GAMM|nr:SDR family NAD(P)-dependent oxidoreductase [Legionella geestiana]KTC99694.1 oxidoreductase with NAD(P)-binding Rossmann-fold domain protein [Legionella geestiana]QBS13183.1 SDR family NAD(P)-dependent oxidoreductase [Legionella geestiana]STX54297.1 oxidoreductase with NAD(P)-binding Rossmann-fold domain [Legionella geestiana]
MSANVSKSVFVTGCSSGIGLACVRMLQSRGYQVIASCRKIEDVERLRAEGLMTVCMDMQDSESIGKGFAEVLSLTGNRLDGLINNAGYGQAGALEDISRDVMREQFETNVFGLMELTRLAIPVMRAAGHGRIINISSLLGFVSMPFRGAYNASKYAVEGLSDTLRLELKPAGIQVITIEPGPVESHFRDSAVDVSLKRIDTEKSVFSKQYAFMLKHYRAQKSESTFTLGPEAVAEKIVRALEARHPKPKYRVTFPTHLFAFLKRVLSTRMLDALLSAISRKEIEQR